MEDSELETVIFAAQIRAIEPSEREIEEVKASLDDLKKMLPEGINPEDDKDLLYCAGNIAVAGVVNRNDDGMDKLTALSIHKKFEKKFIDFEHSRKQVVGYVLHAGLSEIGTNRLLTEEEAEKSDEPFNVALVFVIWKAINPDLADDIVAASNPAHSNYNSISLSFEMAFKGYYIAVLPDDEIHIARATKLVTPDAPDFAKWRKTLRAYKGNGKPLEGEGHAYRILPYNTIPLGGGLVENPAAPVKGITIITEAVELPKIIPETISAPAQTNTEQDELYMAAASVNFNIFYDKVVNLAKIGVSQFTPTIITNSHMDTKEIQAYKDKASKAEKLEDFKEVAIASSVVIDAIAAESERRELAKKAAETRASEIEALKIKADSDREQALKDLTAIKQELDQIKAAQASETQARKFDERMNVIAETFEFSDDERAEVAADIKSLDDEAFAKYLDKSKKMMKEKTKMFKKEKCDEAKAAREQLVASLKAKGVEIKFGDNLNVEEIIASAVAHPTSTPEGTVIQPSKTLKDRAEAAFANVTIGGKKISELSSSK